MVILTDQNPRWRPCRYVSGQFPVQSEPGEEQLPCGVRKLGQELERLDKEKNMPFVNFIERHALEKGLEKGRGEGRLDTLRWYLKTKFGDEALAWLSAAENISDETQLKELCERIFKADTADKVRALLVPPNGKPSPSP
jgi:hypothetical protein